MLLKVIASSAVVLGLVLGGPVGAPMLAHAQTTPARTMPDDAQNHAQDLAAIDAQRPFGIGEAVSPGQVSSGVQPLWHEAPDALAALSRQDAGPLFVAARREAVRGGIDAQHLLGLLYREGIGTTRDPVQAALWLSRAAANNNPLAQLVRCVDSTGLPGASDCNLAAEAGVPRARAIVASRQIEQGQDIEGALALLADAAGQGDSLALILLGRLHYDGFDASYEPAKAVSYWQRASLQGDAEAYRLLGLAYLEGEGVEQETNHAFELFLEAAHRGDPHAQHLVGIAYSDGYHLPFDRVQSLGWVNLAREGLRGMVGYDEVAEDYKRLLSGLSRAETLQAEAFVRAFQPIADERGALFIPGPLFTRRLQEGLAAAGFSPGAIDGLMGDATHEAVTRFLASFGLSSSRMNQLTLSIVATVLQTHGRETGEPRLASGPYNPGTPVDLPRGFDDLNVAQRQLYSYGTGFFVADGVVVTNNHVIQACREVRIEGLGETQTIGTDPAADLALLHVDHTPDRIARLRDRDPRQGESVYVYGYPLRTLLSKGAVMTEGMVNALAGVSDDQGQMQISAAVQPGNSGGPLIDRSGLVVGIVAARIRDEIVLAGAGAVPQNVNFAVKMPALYDLLDVHGVSVARADSAPRLDAVDVADEARAYTVAIECWR